MNSKKFKKCIMLWCLVSIISPSIACQQQHTVVAVANTILSSGARTIVWCTQLRRGGSWCLAAQLAQPQPGMAAADGCVSAFRRLLPVPLSEWRASKM